MTEKFRAVSPQLLENEPMSRHTTFRIGGPADMFVSAGSAEETAELIRLAKENSIPYMVMGNGSNMLVGDKGIRGLIIQIGPGMTDCEIDGTTVTAGAGILMSKLATEILKAELSGFEALSGIPGTLGGGIFMNAGAYGAEIKNVVKSVTYLDDDGKLHEISGGDCRFGYRKSIFSEGGKYVVSAALELERGSYDDIKAAMADYNKRRSDKQPLSMPSAGSTFKRPEGYFAGKLIQDAGLMGYSIGGAQVSDKHAGFIVNKGGAAAADVLALIDYIQKTVKEKFDVVLEPEVRLIGER
ncbi:MAG: UDP-N-acetylmuramate dehydrogenase [Candidatus Ornithomonoglobus sp.]